MAKQAGITKTQLERLRVDLLERKRWLLGEIRERIGEGDSAETVTGGDDADRASFATNLELSLDATARESREIQLIEEALQKIDDGTYGQCGECGRALSLARLEALPFAENCIECQERLEQQQEEEWAAEPSRFRPA